VVQGSGTLTFDTDGNLTASAGSATFNFTGGGAAGQAVNIGFGPTGVVTTGLRTTQFADDSSTTAFTQDGFAAGQLQNIVIDRDGYITGLFSNGETMALAQVGLASFPNVEGLVAVGNSLQIESRASGQPLIGQPQTGSLGAIRSSNLEQSTVDLATELVRLIINIYEIVGFTAEASGSLNGTQVVTQPKEPSGSKSVPKPAFYLFSALPGADTDRHWCGMGQDFFYAKDPAKQTCYDCKCGVKYSVCIQVGLSLHQ